MPEPGVIFELTNLCQLDCLHCLVADRDRTQSLPLDLYEEILRQVSSYGIRKLAFTGGEPTLHPQFADVLDIACRRGFKFSLVTNAWNFANTLPLLLKHRQALEWVTFSLDGAREETHDHLRAAGSYRRVLNAMDLCKKEGIPFYVQMVLTSRSYTEVEQMCNLALEKGATLLRFMECAPTYRSAEHGLNLPPEKYVEIGTEVAKMTPKYRPKLFVMMSQGAHPPIPWLGCESLTMALFTIDAKGSLVLCSNVAGYAGCPPGPEIVADLRQVSFFDAHRGLIQLINRFRLDKVEAIEKGTVSVRDANFPCWYCAKYFNKTGWLRGFPGHPWNEWNATEPAEASLRIAGQV